MNRPLPVAYYLLPPTARCPFLPLSPREQRGRSKKFIVRTWEPKPPPGIGLPAPLETPRSLARQNAAAGPPPSGQRSSHVGPPVPPLGGHSFAIPPIGVPPHELQRRPPSVKKAKPRPTDRKKHQTLTRCAIRHFSEIVRTRHFFYSIGHFPQNKFPRNPFSPKCDSNAYVPALAIEPHLTNSSKICVQTDMRRDGHVEKDGTGPAHLFRLFYALQHLRPKLRSPADHLPRHNEHAVSRVVERFGVLGR